MCMQSTAAIACRELGFGTGSFRGIQDDAVVSPPWLSSVQCVGFESEFGDCDRSVFGDTSTCGPSLRLFCSNDGAASRSLEAFAAATRVS